MNGRIFEIGDNVIASIDPPSWKEKGVVIKIRTNEDVNKLYDREIVYDVQAETGVYTCYPESLMLFEVNNIDRVVAGI